MIFYLLLLLGCFFGVRGLKPIKTLIVGGGPGGLLCSHSLLSRYKNGFTYDCQIVESRSDPRSESAGPRSYSLGLNIRGQSAIKYFDKPGKSFGLFHQLQREGVYSESFFLHIGKLKVAIRKPQKNGPPPTLMIPRNRLVAAMIQSAEQLFGERFKIRYDTSVNSINLKTKTATLSDGTTIQYDLLIGTDGIYSEVRKAMTKEVEDFKSEEVVLRGQYKVFVQDCPETLEPDAIHAMEATSKDKNGFGLFLIPAPNKKICGLVTWKDANNMPVVLQEGEPSAIQKAIATDFPIFGEPASSAIEQLSNQKPSIALTVKCNNYANGPLSVLLLGDSAHSTGGTLGQGANSALMDVVALNDALDACDDDIPKSLLIYSKTQQPEGTALWKLLQLPPKGPLGIVYQLDQILRGVFSKLLPFLIPKPMQNALSQSLTPFTTIVKQNWLWVWLSCKGKPIVA